MEEKLGEAPSSKEEDEAEVVQLIGVVLRRSSGKVGASMVGGLVELLHGLVRDRVREVNEGVRRAREGVPRWVFGVADAWGQGENVAFE